MVGIKYNPSQDYMGILWRYHDISTRGSVVEPTYGGNVIEAVLLIGDVDLADPKTDFFIQHKPIKLYENVVLVVIELSDGTLWSVMTEDVPNSVNSGSFRGSSYVRECKAMIGSAVTRFFLLHALSDENLTLHRNRFLAPKKKSNK